MTVASTDDSIRARSIAPDLCRSFACKVIGGMSHSVGTIDWPRPHSRPAGVTVGSDLL
jgi:hypothetical protein